MNKTEMIKELANRTQMSQKDVAKVIDELPAFVKETVATGEKINLVGFMTLEKKHVDEKSGKSKLGGVEKPWTTPAHDEIKVSLSKNYRQL